MRSSALGIPLAVGLVLLAVDFDRPIHQAEAQDRDPAIPRRARDLNQEGIRLYRAKQYREALSRFEQALGALPQERTRFRLDVRLNVANAHHMLREYDRARRLYQKLLRDDPPRAHIYRAELEKVRLKASAPVTVKGDARLARLVRRILKHYPGLQHPIEVLALTAKQNTREHLARLGVPTTRVEISESATLNGRHLLLYNAPFWRGASDDALVGNLAHELMHREWEDLGCDAIFTWTRDSIGYTSIELAVDACVMGKGLQRELYLSKAFLLERLGDHYLKWDISLNVHHLADLFTRAAKFRMPGRTDRIREAPVPKSLTKDVKERLSAFSWR